MISRTYENNQGASNSYNWGQGKIENSFGRYRKSSSMADQFDQKNMYSSDEECDYSTPEFGDYSDLEFETQGDRYAEEQELTLAQILKQQQEEEEQQRFEEARRKRAERFTIRDPADMKTVRPPMVLPSVDEMESEYQQHLQAEHQQKLIIWAVLVIECVVSAWLPRRRAQKEVELRRQQDRELRYWNRIRSKPRRGIRQLGVLETKKESFKPTYRFMIKQKKINAEIQAALNERARMIAVRAENERKRIARQRLQAKRAKARARAKMGMNKKSAWHKDRAQQSLACVRNGGRRGQHVAREANGVEGTGKRAMRKKRIAKEIAQAKKDPPPKDDSNKIVFVNFITEEKEEEEIDPTLTEEQIEEKNKEREEEKKAEADAEAEALAALSRHIAKKTEEAEEKKKKDEEEKKEQAEQAEEEDHFLATMSRNMGLVVKKAEKKKAEKKKRQRQRQRKTVIHIEGKSFLEKSREKRCASDSKYAKRTEAFDLLTDKKKQAEALKFTRLCRSVTSGKKCYHKSCRFAHSVDQLQIRECRFGSSCLFVKHVRGPWYKNTPSKRSGKICDCYHEGETKETFSKRMGLKYTPEKKAEIKVEKKAEVKIAKTRTVNKTIVWSGLVRKSLTADEKQGLYGKGAAILGEIEEKKDVVPVALTLTKTTRQHGDRRGLGYEGETERKETDLLSGITFVQGATLEPEKKKEKKKEKKPIAVVVKRSTVSVSAPGFSWAKGTVKRERKSRKRRWDQVDPMVKVRSVVSALNQRIQDQSSNRKTEIQSRVAAAKAKAAEINKRLADKLLAERVAAAKAKAAEINKRLADKLLTERVTAAKAKAAEINLVLAKKTRARAAADKVSKRIARRSARREARRLERKERREGWTKVKSSRHKTTHKPKKTKSETVVFRIPREHEEMALLSAIRSGIVDFRIEYLD